MFFTDKSPTQIRDTYTIFAHDQNHDIPILNFIRGEGPALPDGALQAVIHNVTSILNGKDPMENIDLHAAHVGWARQSNGMRLFVRHSEKLADRSSVYVLFSQSCPSELVREVYNRLAEGGMGKIMKQIH